MSGLHSEAKRLIEAAKRGEAPPSPETLARVHRSVLQRAAVLAAAAAATGSAAATAKAALGVSLATKLIVASAAGAALTLGLISVHSTWIAPAKPSASHSRSAPAQVSITASLASSEPEAGVPGVVDPAFISGTATLHDAAPATDPTAPASISGRANTRGAAAPSELPPQATAAPGIIVASDMAPRTGLPPPATARAHPIDEASQRLNHTQRPRPYTQAPAVTPRDHVTLPKSKELEEVSAPPQDTPEAIHAQPVRSQASTAPGPVQESARAEATRGAAETPRDTNPRLMAELRLLRRVHAALRSGHAAEALDLLEDNEAIVRGGHLEQEARGAAISALCQLGRERAARAALERFRSRWPRTPLASRLQDGCRSLGGTD